MKIHILSIFAAAAIGLAATSTASAENILGIDGEESTSIGIYIKDLRNGNVIVDCNSQLALTPASVMKAITTASALSVNGPDRCFSTPVVLRGHAQGRTWHGDIVIRSCADPTIESENFKSRLGFCDSIAAAIARAGVAKVTGQIIVEQTLRDAGPVLQWEIEDVAWPYGCGLFGFNWRDNTFRLHPATGKTEPEVPGLKVELRRSPSGNDLVRGVDSNKLIVYARSTTDKKWVVNTSMPDPAAVFALELTKKLTEKGISLGGKAGTAGETPKEKTVYTRRSAPFSDIMRSLMVRSDNLFAEGILRSINPAASRRDVIKREKEIWATRGINPKYTIINDGSGLTRGNKLSARFIGEVLEWMAKSPHADTYSAFFPRAGKEGTMRGFLAKSELKGKIALKTGSVSAVQTYAGYKLDADDKPTHVVVILVNGFFCPRRQVREGAENLLTKIFEQ